MIDELTIKYDQFKEVIDILPTNTKNNRKRKMGYIVDEEERDNERLESVKKEIEKRISCFNKLKQNKKIEEINAALEKCNIVNEWNEYNTAYEKMHLDYYLYQLHRYYKEDLKSVNTCIKKILESFKKVNIVLTINDFDYNKYAQEYMDKILNNVSEEKLDECFEELYWKNPDIIKIIEINFKSIYLKYESRINKYYSERHNEFLKSHKDLEIYDMRINLNEQLNESISLDKAINFEHFKNGEYAIVDFKEDDIVKKQQLYFDNDSYSYEALKDLAGILNEYNILIKYKYLFDDMKGKLEKKNEFKDSRLKVLKSIAKEEASLRKLNAKQNKKSIFFKKKNDEKWIFEYKNVITNISKLYDEFDNECFNDLVYKKLNQDSTILEILKLITSNYLYFVSKTYLLDDSQDISSINDKYNSLRDYVNNTKFTLLNNVALLDEKQMKQLIVDKYNLGHIKLTIDSLLSDNIDKTISDIKSLINYEDVINSGISINDISLYLEYSKLLEKNK